MQTPDYQRLIDAETWSFIRETESWYPPEATSFSIAKQRAVYDAMCRAFFRGYPEGVSASDRLVGGVPCRLYTAAPDATVIYFHGGGFVVGGLDSHDDVCADICNATGFRVISVDYRRAPEHTFPAAMDDALVATRAALSDLPGPIILAGDSFGGRIAAATTYRMRGTPRIVGQVLIYPGLGGNMDRGSYLVHANAPMLTRDDLLFYRKQFFAGAEEPPNEPTAAPLWAPSFAGLPPTVTFAAECDPVADDARAYVELVAAEGGRAQHFAEAGLVHGYLRARHTVTRARESFTRITEAVAALGHGRWPYGPAA